MTDDEAIENLTKTCEFVIETLRSLDNKLEGSAIERVTNLRKMLGNNGEITQMKDRLSRTLTLTHWEARHGNIGIMVPSKPIFALGYVVLAEEHLKQSILDADPSHEANAVSHLRTALQALKNRQSLQEHGAAR